MLTSLICIALSSPSSTWRLLSTSSLSPFVTVSTSTAYSASI
uniref:Uncharacterized protein n=1 Tax=Cucumis melo TaxID=3656 RepID=A0A9I9EH00_CUCME